MNLVQSTHRFEIIISSMHGDLGVGMPLIDHKFLTLILDLCLWATPYFGVPLTTPAGESHQPNIRPHASWLRSEATCVAWAHLIFSHQMRSSKCTLVVFFPLIFLTCCHPPSSSSRVWSTGDKGSTAGSFSSEGSKGTSASAFFSLVSGEDAAACPVRRLGRASCRPWNASKHGWQKQNRGRFNASPWSHWYDHTQGSVGNQSGWGMLMHDHAWSNMIRHHRASPCITMHYHALPCITMHYQSLPCITMHHQDSHGFTMIHQDSPGTKSCESDVFFLTPVAAIYTPKGVVTLGSPQHITE